mmetsp:Transcript_6732/g.6573  ORF Transcript_6732/g.6573 Transcript_6732/m.6573 type:complete len:150 (+) Transcript_6732:335-784(+)
MKRASNTTTHPACYLFACRQDITLLARYLVRYVRLLLHLMIRKCAYSNPCVHHSLLSSSLCCCEYIIVVATHIKLIIIIIIIIIILHYYLSIANGNDDDDDGDVSYSTVDHDTGEELYCLSCHVITLVVISSPLLDDTNVCCCLLLIIN